MTPWMWIALAMEILLAAWVARMIWRVEETRPPEEIGPATADEVKLVG